MGVDLYPLGFNPRPSSLTGDPLPSGAQGFGCCVFQSAPVITDGRSPALSKHGLGASWFQSAPVITDGRSRQSRYADSQSTCFNPRPSSLTGDPAKQTTDEAVKAMFQSAPVITDGRSLSWKTMQTCVILFQSAPVITDGRSRVVQLDCFVLDLFQSAPVITDGRSLHNCSACH